MIFSYYGLSCFKIQSGENVLALDPFGKGRGFSPPRFEAQVVILTDPHQTSDFSLGGEPLVFSTPGEYEAKNIWMIGFEAHGATPFFIEWEELKILHLDGTIKQEPLERVLDAIETIDILLISPSGSARETQKIISSIHPRVIILMEKKFPILSLVKEMGEKPEKLDKLTIKKKNLPADGQRLIILETS